MPGFDNNTVYADNVDFRGVQPVIGQITTDGQLLIGSTATPHIRAGNLTSLDSSVTITAGAGTIDLSASGGASAPTLSVSMTTGQSMTQNALVDIVYDTVMVDTASGYSAGVYTIPSTGNWFVSVVSLFQSTVTFINCDIFLNKNNGTFIYHGQPCMSVSDPSVVTVNGGSIFPLVAGDTLKVSVFAQTTGSTNYTVSGVANGFYNIMSIYRVS
jgi:hypothetical protein